jgi:hypothetical protein
MAIDGNDISCDHFGCREVATFTGELSGVDIRTRYHMLGWQICESDGREDHRCPRHADSG